MQAPEADHDYSIRGTTFDTGDLFVEPGQEHSEQGPSSVSTNASPTSSASAGSPGLSPSPTIPDSNKYKKNMLWRYLNDVTEAHQNLSKDCKSDGESRSSLSESDVPEVVAQEIVYPPASPTGQAPASGSHEESLLQGRALALDTPPGAAGGGGGHGEVGVEGQVGAGAALQIGRLVTFPSLLQFGGAEGSGSSNLDVMVAFLFLLQIDLFYKLL